MKKLPLTPVPPPRPADHGGHHHGHGDAVPDPRAIDPVCGMRVSPEKAAGSHEFEGVTYYFCARSCLARFQASPRAYLKTPRLCRRRRTRRAAVMRTPKLQAARTPGDPAREYTCPMDPEVRQVGPGSCPKCGMALEPVDVVAPTRTEWTCPMHPEIVREAPGSCPICGMALEPRVLTLEERNPELDAMTRRFFVSALATLPILLFMVSEMLPGNPLRPADPGPARNWVELTLATPVVLWGAGHSSSVAGRRS